MRRSRRAPTSPDGWRCWGLGGADGGGELAGRRPEAGGEPAAEPLRGDAGARAADRLAASRRRRVPRREGHVRERDAPGHRVEEGFQGSGARRSAQPPGTVPAAAGSSRGASGGPRRGRASGSPGPSGAARLTSPRPLWLKTEKGAPHLRARETTRARSWAFRGTRSRRPRASRGPGLWSSLGLGTGLK